MSSTTPQQASPGIGLLICLAIIVLPPVLATAISLVISLTKRYGQALLYIAEKVGIWLVFMIQLVQIFAAFGCMYYFGRYAIPIDAVLPDTVIKAYSAIMLLVLALGFLALGTVALYLMEFAVWPFEMKKPTELAAVELSMWINGMFFNLFLEEFAMQKANLSAPFFKTKKDAVAAEKSSQREEEEAEQSEHPEEEEDEEEEAAASDESSVIDMEGFSAIEQWK